MARRDIESARKAGVSCLEFDRLQAQVADQVRAFRGDLRGLLHKGGLLSGILACAVVASCTSRPEPKIRIIRHPDSYALKFRIPEIAGLCYAPQSYRFNGYLELDGLDGVDTWTVAAAAPEQVEGLAKLLSAKRVRIGSGDMELSVPKDSIAKRPSHLQFVAFPCEAPTVPERDRGKLHIVSLSVDLPPALPTEPARLDAPGLDNEMMPPR